MKADQQGNSISSAMHGLHIHIECVTKLKGNIWILMMNVKIDVISVAQSVRKCWRPNRQKMYVFSFYKHFSLNCQYRIVYLIRNILGNS